MSHTYIFSKIKKYKSFVEVGLALIVMIILFINGDILSKITFLNVIETFLSFIILVEVIRMIGQYITRSHIEISLIIDAVIIFFSRDILLTATNKDYTFLEKFQYIGLFLIIIFFFFSFRARTIELDDQKENQKENQKQE